ncbi:MAG: YIP1 family protein [Paracoccaceae bacterium]
MNDNIADDLPEVHLADVQQPLEPVQGMSVWARMRLSFRDMRAAVRDLIDEVPSEPRLLFFVLLSDVIFFLSFGVRLVVSPSALITDLMNRLPPAIASSSLGISLVGILMIRTMLMYIFSAVVCIVCRIFGGRGGFRDTRAGVFWASLVAAPVGVIGAAIGAGFAHLEPDFPFLASPLFAWPPLLIGIIAFVYFISAAVAEAQRFTRTSPVFIIFSVLTVILLIGTMIGVEMLVARLGLNA